ncbi:conserved hypothetical protein [Talaromyces stipitatus ATCC 10500]|uniref:5-Methylcytosine G/T mismatch-specific DNA glycosylase n=1 Tax=Talaromyces stipitatus (strain ATCC 10500 / CBS 375.48 / QM 6759 / NRRL 1006) TaxID=441959 RepID=B8MB49_TALSN|nr:uncharacterized protein TSTA_124690 [Talaromyces stipitatus ATCC 10500]EED18750.1 conserved hypothetical protein [Talaromyces stipitatus ATCC 10500]
MSFPPKSPIQSNLYLKYSLPTSHHITPETHIGPEAKCVGLPTTVATLASGRIMISNWTASQELVDQAPLLCVGQHHAALSQYDRDLDKGKIMAKSPKTKDRERDAVEKDKEKRRYSRPSHGKRTGTSTRDRDSTMTSSTSSSHTRTRRSSMPEIDSNADSAATSFLDSRASLPYPALNKAHSKVALWGKPDSPRQAEIPTPDPTDVDHHENRATTSRNGHRHGTPPSPPLTADQRSSRVGSSIGSKHKDKERDTKVKSRKDPTQSTSSLGRNPEDGSRVSTKSPRSSTPIKVRLRDSPTPHRTSSHRTSKSTSQSSDLPKRAASHSSRSATHSIVHSTDNISQYTTDSDATSIAPNQAQVPLRPKTHSPQNRARKHSPPIEVFIEEEESVVNGNHDQSSSSLPPPPPPPPQMPVAPPRVDYLLQNGGLRYPVPKHLLGAGLPPNAPDHLPHQQNAIVQAFEPYHRLLDDYNKVLSKNGSLAVATGYRSVARRLLDRLEAVFARDISSETCQCVMCDGQESDEMTTGVSWGEVLELVSGRRELPSWPPFHMPAPTQDQIAPGEEHIPMQKLDIDVPEEYRDHYVRQSRKTKQAVDKWLLGQTDSNAPEEVDDETLAFAMMTYLDTEQRDIFCTLLGIKSSTPVPRSATPAPRPRPEPLIASSLAIQRLYRLAAPARDSETALYMLKNPLIHNVLATLAAISDDEWEILISGRFDGFLRSGAEDTFNPALSASRAGTPFVIPSSRGPTPFQMDPIHRPMSQPYGSTISASYGAPIGLDEDMEIAVLAEIEKDIFQSMEALEDAFEALHCKAEAVRRALRERGAGLSVANQARRGSSTNLDARLGTPASMAGSLWENALDEDDGIDDDMSLAPDDSASNISSNRRRRPKRRNERRTPAPVEEEDEEEDDYDARRMRRR